VSRRMSVFALAVALACAPEAVAANKDMERLQIQIASLQGQIAELQRTVEDGQREVKRLNEALAEQAAALRKAMQDRRLQDESISTNLRDLAERMSLLTEQIQTARAAAAVREAPPPVTGQEGGVGPSAGSPSTAPAPTAPSSGPPPAPRELYTQAYADYARGNFDLAIQEYQEYLRNYPDTDLSDNAQYWIGECLYSKGKFVEAVDAWNELLGKYTSSDKLPDARFKKGMALERLGRRSQALVEYRYVADRYPNSEAGKKARERLSPR
jgi:tol-pal system protein YbgF